MRLKKSIICLVLLMLAIGGLTHADSINVAVNGEQLVFDVPPVIENGRTLVPLRAIFEKLGAQIVWDGETRTISASKDDVEVVLVIGNASATINGLETPLDVPAKIVNGRTMVPVRFVSEAMGSIVGWDGVTRTVIIREAKLMDTEIRSNQTWTKEEGPFIISGKFSIPKGSKLTVEPGTEIYVKLDIITVTGILELSGTENQKIYIFDQSPSKLGKIFMRGEDSKVEYVTTGLSFEYNKTTKSEIRNSEFREVVAEFSDGFKAVDNVINGGVYGISIYQSDNVVISGNSISNSEKGISFKMCKTSEVTLNTILNCDYGIVSNSNSNCKVVNNDITNSSKYGIFIDNASYGNEYYYNNLIGNTVNAKVDIGERTINMFDNYWGVHKAELVGDTIEDYNDNRDLTEIYFEPILTEPYSN